MEAFFLLQWLTMALEYLSENDIFSENSLNISELFLKALDRTKRIPARVVLKNALDLINSGRPNLFWKSGNRRFRKFTVFVSRDFLTNVRVLIVAVFIIPGASFVHLAARFAGVDVVRLSFCPVDVGQACIVDPGVRWRRYQTDPRSRLIFVKNRQITADLKFV
jgi:hypothetical protein